MRSIPVRTVFEALYKRNKKYFYYPFFNHLFIDILRLRKKINRKKKLKIHKVMSWQSGGSKKKDVLACMISSLLVM